MAKLILKSNEFTVTLLLEYIQQQFKQKLNGSPFSVADIHDWANKGRVPKQYGGQYITFSKLGPLKVLKLSEFEDESSKEIEILKS